MWQLKHANGVAWGDSRIEGTQVREKVRKHISTCATKACSLKHIIILISYLRTYANLMFMHACVHVHVYLYVYTYVYVYVSVRVRVCV